MHEHFKSSGDFFKVLDVNGDGVIQHEEFQRSMKKIFKGGVRPFQQPSVLGSGRLFLWGGIVEGQAIGSGRIWF